MHDEAARAEDTDWPQILALYGLLKRMSDNPMVTLNHAIATAMVHGPAAGLELLEALDADCRLAGHHRLDAVRAHLLEMAGDHQAAVAHYRAAAGRTTSIPERNYLAANAATAERSCDGQRPATWRQPYLTRNTRSRRTSGASLNAAVMLSRCKPESSFDNGRFERVVGGPVRLKRLGGDRRDRNLEGFLVVSAEDPRADLHRRGRARRASKEANERGHSLPLREIARRRRHDWQH